MLLKAHDLRIEREDIPLFSGISFAVPSGSLLWVRGANGSGKTSLLKSLLKLQALSAGTVQLAEDATLYLAHQLGIKATLTCSENLTFLLALHRKKQKMSVEAALRYVGLADYLQTRASHLSRGQQQRLGLARFCLMESPLWIMDEPLTALDEAGRALLQAMLLNHLNNQGAAILSSHQALSLTGITPFEIQLGALNE